MQRPTNHRNTLTPGQILALVHVVFADADVVSSRLFPGQHASLNYDLQLAHPEVNVVLKVYLDGSEHKPWKEAYLLRLLTSETGVPAPGLLHFDDSTATIPHPWALHTRLPGQPLAESLDALQEWELESLGYEIGRYLGRIHQIPLDVFGEFYAPELRRYGSEREYVASQVHPWLDRCAQEALLPTETIEPLSQLFAGTDLLNRHQARLIHGAYDEHHVIVERGATGYHVTGVLDLKHAIGGSPELDMTRFLGCQFEGKAAFHKEFLDGYAESGKLEADFWDRLRLYKLFTCVRCLSSTPQRDRLGLEACRQSIRQHLR
jgi:aminoglycoside phosphotransferase (APT) family kinase protein